MNLYAWFIAWAIGFAIVFVFSSAFYYEPGPRNNRPDRVRRAGIRAFRRQVPLFIGMAGGILVGGGAVSGDWIVAALGAALVVIAAATIYATRPHRGRVVR